MKVGRVYRFRASHYLPDIPEWSEPHEHDYTVTVEAFSSVKAPIDMEAWDRRFERLAGKDLNEIFNVTTVEGLAESFSKALQANVTVVEDDNRWATCFF